MTKMKLRCPLLVGLILIAVVLITPFNCAPITPTPSTANGVPLMGTSPSTSTPSNITFTNMMTNATIQEDDETGNSSLPLPAPSNTTEEPTRTSTTVTSTSPTIEPPVAPNISMNLNFEIALTDLGQMANFTILRESDIMQGVNLKPSLSNSTVAIWSFNLSSIILNFAVIDKQSTTETPGRNMRRSSAKIFIVIVIILTTLIGFLVCIYVYYRFSGQYYFGQLKTWCALRRSHLRGWWSNYEGEGSVIFRRRSGLNNNSFELGGLMDDNTYSRL